jgi:SprT protein
MVATTEVMTITTSELLKDVQEQVNFWSQLAEEIYDDNLFEFGYPIVDFKLRGRTAGKASWYFNQININETLLRENFARFKERTIPHEVAHIVAGKLTNGRCKPHGRHWKSIMIKFGCETSRCHNYDVSNSKARTVSRQYRYECNCQEAMFTSIRHKRAQGQPDGLYYSCRKCRSYFIYSP